MTEFTIFYLSNVVLRHFYKQREKICNGIFQRIFWFKDWLFFLVSYSEILLLEDLLFSKICFISCLYLHFRKVVSAMFIKIKSLVSCENNRIEVKSQCYHVMGFRNKCLLTCYFLTLPRFVAWYLFKIRFFFGKVIWFPG